MNTECFLLPKKHQAWQQSWGSQLIQKIFLPQNRKLYLQSDEINETGSIIIKILVGFISLGPS